MKKLTIAAAVFTIFSGVNAQAASTGTITFNGLLTTNTCDVSVNNEGPDTTITLPTIGVNQLPSANTTAGQTNFTMALTGCSGSLKTASAFFEDGASVDPNGRLKNVSGTANNVVLQLRDATSASRNVIQAGNTNQAANTSYVDISTGSASLPYAVEYFATGATGPGTVISNVVYSLQYK